MKMEDHSHNLQVCARCVSRDLRLILSRLAEHNATMYVTTESQFAETHLRVITELMEDACEALSAYDTP